MNIKEFKGTLWYFYLSNVLDKRINVSINVMYKHLLDKVLSFVFLLMIRIDIMNEKKKNWTISNYMKDSTDSHNLRHKKYRKNMFADCKYTLRWYKYWYWWTDNVFLADIGTWKRFINHAIRHHTSGCSIIMFCYLFFDLVKLNKNKQVLYRL